MKHWLHLGVLLCAVILFTGSAQARPEPNAFLNRSVHTVDELIKQMRSDPAVLARYQKHYKMNKEELTAYFQTLRLITLPDGRYYLTFNVDSKGVYRSKKVYYPRGTRVFVDKQGVPVMKRSCGNPTSFGPKGLQRTAFAGKRKQTLLPEPPLDPAEFGFAPEPILLAALPVEAEPLPGTAGAGTGAGTPAAGGATPAAAPAPGGVIPAVLAINPWPWLVPGGAIIGILPGSGGSVGGDPGPPVPEPGTMAVFAFGMAALARRRRTQSAVAIALQHGDAQPPTASRAKYTNVERELSELDSSPQRTGPS